MGSYTGNIEELTLANTNFRQVLWTGQHAQLVLMNLLPNEEIGLEIHAIVDQFIRVEKGTCKAIIDGVETELQDGSAIIIPAGTKHNVVNTSSTEELKIYTLYSPDHHKDGTVHKTKAEADKDTED